MDNKNRYFGGLRCRFCGLVVSACLCVATLAHSGEHPEARSVKWPAPDRLIVTSTSTASVTISPLDLGRWFVEPPGSSGSS